MLWLIYMKIEILIAIDLASTSNRKQAQVMYVSLYVCMTVCIYVCFFNDISRYKALSESKVVPDCIPVNRTLHRHYISGVRFLTSTRRAKIEERLLS